MPPLLLLFLACGASPPPPANPPATEAVVAAPASYDDVTTSLAVERSALTKRYRESATDEARTAVLSAARTAVEQVLVDEIFPRWFGTPWDFYGTTQVPGQGEIACGYFVSTTLQHAGFQVERVRLAQQAAEHIILSFVNPRAVKRFRGVPVSTVVQAVQAQGDGLYLVGLDYHVGYLVHRDGQVDMCHASWIADGVVCEDAATAEAMVSRYTVIGRLLDDRMILRWLSGTRFPTRTG